MAPTSYRPNVRKPRRRRRPRRRKVTLKVLRRLARRRWRELRTFLRAWWKSPPALRWTLGAVLLVVLWLSVNWLYHALVKPTELLFPLDRSLAKIPAETWREYGPLFRKHSTPIITPELLAALAQVEGAGNPVARTYWRWRLTWNPLEWYQPASSAVGMYQITDATFRAAKRYCIHDHVVIEDGPWHDWQSCWFNSLYTRVLPSHAIELTAALLDRSVASVTGPKRKRATTLQQKQDLAAVIHLCGAAAGQAFAARGFRPAPRQKCGDHDLKTYLAKINGMKRQFARLAVDAESLRYVSPR